MFVKVDRPETVETSVTTINSLSQDFINLDDQPSQTLTGTPGFKSFTLKYTILFSLRSYLVRVLGTRTSFKRTPLLSGQ